MERTAKSPQASSLFTGIIGALRDENTDDAVEFRRSMDEYIFREDFWIVLVSMICSGIPVP